jgi:hypothetical protein
MSQAIVEALVAGVGELTTVVASENQLLDNITALLDAALLSATPVEEVQAVIDTIKATKDAAAAAVIRNTRP